MGNRCKNDAVLTSMVDVNTTSILRHVSAGLVKALLVMILLYAILICLSHMRPFTKFIFEVIFTTPEFVVIISGKILGKRHLSSSKSRDLAR